MGVRLSHLKAKGEVTAAVDFLGESVDFGFNPALLTPELLDQWQAMADDPKLTTSRAIGQVIPQFVTWWDVLDEGGARLPVTPEVAATFPIQLLEAIMDKAMEAGKAGKASESDSSSFS